MQNIISIDNINEIPDIPIYYIKELNQYAIKINGVLYRGNIGNIYNKYDIVNKHSNDNNIKNVLHIIPCKHKNKCNTLLNKSHICKFYHDILDVYNLYKDSKISEEKYILYKNTHKNFINTNWLYTNNPKNDKNKNIRHFGSNNELKYDIEIIKLDHINNSEKNIDYIENFKSQLIHDILIGNELKNNNLIK